MRFDGAAFSIVVVSKYFLFPVRNLFLILRTVMQAVFSSVRRTSTYEISAIFWFSSDGNFENPKMCGNTFSSLNSSTSTILFSRNTYINLHLIRSVFDRPTRVQKNSCTANFFFFKPPNNITNWFRYYALEIVQKQNTKPIKKLSSVKICISFSLLMVLFYHSTLLSHIVFKNKT